MHSFSFNIFKGRPRLYQLAGGLIPVIYIIFLLFYNYNNNIALRESSINRFKLDIEKQAATIAYFLLERKNDIQIMAASSEIMTHFLNKSMGMSEQYGLNVSLFTIRQMMQRDFMDKAVENDNIYKYFGFYNLEKKRLVSVISPNADEKHFIIKSDLDLSAGEPKLFFEETKNGYEILIAAPCFFKKKIVGWTAGWLDMNTLYKHFMGPAMKLSFNASQNRGDKFDYLNLGNNENLDFPWEKIEQKIAGLDRVELIFADEILEGAPPVLLTQAKIEPLSLYLNAYVSKKDILGHIENWQYLATTSIVVFLLLFGFSLLIQSHTKRLVLKTRFDESKKQHILLTQKNMQLGEEITKRENTEKTLKESEGRYRKLFESSSDAILIIMGNKIVDCNRQTTELLGASHGELIDKSLYDFSPVRQADGSLSEEKSLKLARRAIEKPQSLEWRLTTKDRTIETEVNMTALPLGEDTYVQVIIRDITQRKKAEEEKIQAQKIVGEQKKLALIGQVAGKMAHDFNNILGIIMGNAELSILRCKDAKTKKTLELIYNQTLRGKNLTKNLIAFAKSQEPKQEFFRINEHIELVLDLLKKDLEGISLIKDYGLGLPDLLADPGMIEHALVNMIQNSIHALSNVKEPNITFRTYGLNKDIGFEIEDNGCGIPEKYLKKIFDPSFTLKGNKDVTGSYQSGIKGTGYGMSNVQKYVEQHKGHISVESEFNLGTRISVRLPVIKNKLTSEEKTTIQKENIRPGRHILLVEDEASISEVQYTVLTHEPCFHKVDVASDGDAAKNLLNRNEYDAISLDYILPGGINGMDIYNYIRKNNKMIPILFVSGNIEFLESIRALKQDDVYIDHISKPCQNKHYVSTLNRLLKMDPLSSC